MVAIAIDGPSSAGKSTVARKISEKLGFLYLDTGALYRAVAFYFEFHKLDYGDEKSVKKELQNINIRLMFKNGEQKVIIDSRDVTDFIRTDRISLIASKMSALTSVRDFLLDLQRNFAKENNVVMDGRDIATVVLPTADVKIFLTATVETRAKRRYLEYIKKGIKCNYEEILDLIKKRDYNDSNRNISPLRIAEDAVVLDTTKYTLDEVVSIILNIVQDRVNI